MMLVLLMTGCTISRKMHIAYTPGDNSPLSTIKAYKFSLVVQDNCPADEKGQFAHINKVILVPDGSIETILADALKQELKKAGHQIVDNNDTNADATVTVNLKRMRFAMRQRGGFELIKTVLIQADVMVARMGQEDRKLKFEVEALNEKSYPLIASGAAEEMINNTFHDFVRNIILDPRFIEPLR